MAQYSARVKDNANDIVSLGGPTIKNNTPTVNNANSTAQAVPVKTTTMSSNNGNQTGTYGNGGVVSVGNGWGDGGSANIVQTPAETAAEETQAKVVPTNLNSAQTRAYLENYNANREQKIKDMYSGNLAAQNAQQQTAYDKNAGALKTAYDANLGNLKTAYDNNTASLKTAYDKNIAQIANSYQQNLSDAEAYRQGISPQYQQAMNALGAEYERQRRNNNMQAAVSGINTGAGSQAALAQSNSYQRNQGNLSRSEMEALNEAERSINDLGRAYRNQQDILNTEYANNVDKLNREYANQQATYGTTYQNNLLDLKTNYQNKIAEAAANNDYQLAAALLDEYGAQYDRTMQQAAQLADFGDFSAYESIFGKEAADQMKQMWAYQNPQIAWAMGAISAEDYQKITGYAPYGANSAYGSSGSSNGVYSPKQTNTVEGRWKNYSPSDMSNFTMSRRYGGGGYSRSLDKAYRGAPGYLNTEGDFVVPGYADASTNFTPYDQAEFDKLAKANGWRVG